MNRYITVVIGILCLIALIVLSFTNMVNGASPVALSLTVQTQTSVSLSWTLSRNGLPGYEVIYGVQLYMSSTGINGTYTNVWEIVNTQVSSTSVNDLSPGTSYCFYTVADGFAGYYDSNTIQVTTSGNPQANSPTPTSTPAATPTPTPTPSPTPTQTFATTPSTILTQTLTPTVPELSWIVIVPLFLSVLSIAVSLRYRKTYSLK